MHAKQRMAAQAGNNLVRPKVSVLLITYNHEKYIAQAIDSVLMQETDFSVVINVVEDCSTDGTASIVRDYAARYPDRIRPFLNEKNIGKKRTQKNFIRGFRTLDGEYLAILEGDDFWTSPLKLQRQVDFLDANPEYAICAHNTIKTYQDGSKADHRFLYHGQREDGSIDNAIMLQMFFHTTGVLYRNVYAGRPPRHYASKWSCDIFVMISHAQFGKIHHIDEDFATYRAHSGGLFSTMSVLDGWFYNIGSLQRYNAWLGYRYARSFSRSIVKYCNVVLSEAGQNEIPHLKHWQRLRYELIRLRYGILLWFLEFPVRVHRSALLVERRVSAKVRRSPHQIGRETEANWRRESTTGTPVERFGAGLVSDALSPTFRQAAITILRRFGHMELSTDRLPNITSFGPDSAVQGTPFNLQPDGESALWLLVSEPLPPQTIVVFDGVAVHTSIVDLVVSAVIPAHLTRRAGLIPVWLEAEMADSIRVSEPVYFESVRESFELPLVVAHGPETTPRGEPFNVQPDGQSWLWIKVATPPPSATVVVFGGVDLPTNIDRLVIAARVSPELVAEARSVPVQLALDGTAGRRFSSTFLVKVV